MNISTHRARKGLKAKRSSPNFIILPIFGPNRGSLWPIWRTRSQSKRETRLEERSGGSVFAVFLFDRFVQTCDLFLLVWWRLWRSNFFQRRLSTTIAQRAFQHGLLATRISERRDFLTCRSSSTGPSNFLATPSCPVMRTQTIIVKVVYILPWQHRYHSWHSKTTESCLRILLFLCTLAIVKNKAVTSTMLLCGHAGQFATFPKIMEPLRIRRLARTKRNALGGKGFGGNIFVAHGRKIFAISLTSSFPVCFFSEPWKIRRPLQLSLTPTLTLHTRISFHFFSGRQRSPLGLYHSLHNHLRHPDDRRPEKEGRRVDPDLALGFSPVLRSKATTSCRRLSSGGFRGVADFVSSIVMAVPGALNYLMIIVAMSWLSGKFWRWYFSP